MGFGSAIFLFGFLPLTALLFHLLPWSRGRRLLLLLASLFFYAFGRLWDLPILLASAVLHYGAGRLLLRLRRGRKAVVAGTVILDLGLLAACKYLSFFASAVNLLPGIALTVPSFPLPLGISFFTFQGISYVVDAYRNREQASRAFFPVLQYLAFFPNLVSGPLIPFRTASPMLAALRWPEARESAEALRRFTVGLGKKLLLAGTLQAVTDAMFLLDGAALDIRTAWLAAVSYSLQLYFDFSGYSDMAVGLGQLFGVRLPENFRHPYRAGSITDFWRRWHISLSAWFRDYLYIPLGGNRRGRRRTLCNKAIVFLATGLWHGANWTFLLWGAWHGLFSILETGRVDPSRKPRWYGHLYALLVVAVGFVLFRAATLGQAAAMIGAMFGGVSLQHGSTLALARYLTPRAVAALVVGAAASLGLFVPLWERVRLRRAGELASYALTLALLALCIMALASGSFQPFIYQQF